jgi:hypothetical protein
MKSLVRPAFQLGDKYSRKQISNELGGGQRASFPTSNGTVVCCCLKKIPRYNPGAPEEATIGEKPKVLAAANRLARQREPVPIFLFSRHAAWEYVGNYRCTGFSRDESLLQQKMRENPERGPIGGVLYFERAHAESAASRSTDEEDFIEGEKRASQTTARSPALRATAKQHWGVKCYCCGFDFQQFYGMVGAGCAIVHHLDMFSTDDDKPRKSTVNGVRVVCANCHYIIHRSSAPMHVDELKRLLSSSWGSWTDDGITRRKRQNNVEIIGTGSKA